MRLLRTSLVIWAFCGLLAQSDASASRKADEGTAEFLVKSCGIPGGVCVVLGNRDGEFAAAVSQQGSFTVQVLCDDRAGLETLRKQIDDLGVYGKVSADIGRYDELPYADNLVNVIIADDISKLVSKGLTTQELFRVLAPLGVVFIGDSSLPVGAVPPWVAAQGSKLLTAGFNDMVLINKDGVWLKARKPWPPEIDEWTHFLHGPDGNPVANDTVVGPPRHYQWISEPLWLRSHESDSSVKTLVTARGRLFYINDEAPISLLGENSPPDKWFLTARDAFNGVLLWKVPIEDWGWRAWKPSWFTPRPGDIPLNIQKRLVAIEDKLYVTLGYHAPASQIDAKTGTVLKTYEGTAQTAEILYYEDSLILTILQDGRAGVVAFDANSGKRLWSSESTYGGTTTDYYRFSAMYGSVPAAKVDPTLNTATDGKVVGLLDGQDVVCLDFKTGKEKWRKQFPTVEADYKAGNINAQRNVWTGTLIVRDGVIVHASPNQLAGFDAESGGILWTQAKKYLQHLWYEWKDVFIIDGLVWTWSAELERGKLEGTSLSSTWPVSVNGYDLHTGKLSKQVPLGNIFKTHHHHRCYRNKATLRYIIASRRGSEYVDLENGRHTINNWVRGTCHLGMMPANGLQYAPPHPCVCYIEEKLNGFIALAPERQKTDSREQRSERLEKGPAYNLKRGTRDDGRETNSWPVFLHDMMRSGAAGTSVSAKLEMLWNVRLGEKVSPPIIAGGRVFTSLTDEHQVIALDSESGNILWKFFAGARVDSPPTCYEGAILFGSADGYVYCLSASDGKLKWRFCAAPADRRMGAFGQLESAWPVSGSVLVLDGTVYFAAGRSSQLDGGIHLFGLDAESGAVKCRTNLDGPHYNVDNISQNYQLPMGSLPDILQSDGTAIYMRDVVLDKNLEQISVSKAEAGMRVIARAGLLDDSYFKRTPWVLSSGDAAKAPSSGYGRLIVHDERRAFYVRMFDSLRGLDPKVFFTPGREGYLLYAVDKQSGKQTWAERINVRIRTMVVAGELLFTAGPPDVVDPKDPLGAFEARKGGWLNVFDTATGKKLAEYKLASPPVFSGAAAANSRLFITSENGSLSAFGDK